MTHPDLAEILERLEFCRTEVDDFGVKTAAFAGEAFSIRVAEEESGLHVVYATQKAPLPSALRSRAGMIINEIRSCLDALAVVLAGRNGKTPTDVFFPISKSEAIFNDDGLKKLRKLSTVDQERIRALRPYQGGDDRLFKLHAADKMRKHLRLVMAGMGGPGVGVHEMRGGTVMLRPTGPALFDAVGKESRVVEVFVAGGDGLKISLDFRIRYAEAPLAHEDVVEHLRHSLAAVHEVVNLFA